MAMETRGTVNGFYFDPEVFGAYIQEKDPVRAELMASGVLFNSPEIEGMVGSKNSVFTVPNYKPLDGDAENRIGNDIALEQLQASKQTGMAFMREKGWTATDFTVEMTGADPLGDCAGKVAYFWQKNFQRDLMAVLGGIFKVPTFADHIYDISGAGETVTEDNKMGLTTVLEAGQKALGDNAQDAFGAIVVHSAVYVQLQKLNLLQMVKGVDANGATAGQGIPYWNNLVVLVDDSVPVEAGKYTSYLLGRGAIATALGKVEVPVEFGRDALKAGGTNFMVSRMKRVFHPIGFSIDPSKVADNSPTRAELAGDIWTQVYDGKNIPLVKIVTNG